MASWVTTYWSIPNRAGFCTPFLFAMAWLGPMCCLLSACGSLCPLWGVLAAPVGLPLGTLWGVGFGPGLGWEAHVGCVLACASRWGSGGVLGGSLGCLGCARGRSLCLPGGPLGLLSWLSGWSWGSMASCGCALPAGGRNCRYRGVLWASLGVLLLRPACAN